MVDAVANSSSRSQERNSRESPSTCSRRHPYRTMDGTCNNVKNPEQGKSNSMQKRLINSRYDDGKCPSIVNKIQCQFTRSKAKTSKNGGLHCIDET